MVTEETSRLAGPAILAFLHITAAWGLTDHQPVVLLGGAVDPTTLAIWETLSASVLSVDQLERCSYVLGIYEALERFFRHAPDDGPQWLLRPRREQPFGGRSALKWMLLGDIEQLADVREFLDHSNGGPPRRDAASPPISESDGRRVL